MDDVVEKDVRSVVEHLRKAAFVTLDPVAQRARFRVALDMSQRLPVKRRCGRERVVDGMDEPLTRPERKGELPDVRALVGRSLHRQLYALASVSSFPTISFWISVVPSGMVMTRASR